MKKIIAATLSACALATMLSATDTSPIYNNQTALETKKLMMLSQLLTTDLDINMKYWPINDKRGFFASFSENTDPKWEAIASIDVVVGNCYSEEQLKGDEKAGYTFLTRNGDVTIVGYREAIKQLKDKGAKYIFVQRGTDDAHGQKYEGKSFSEYFQGYLQGDREIGLPDGSLNVGRSMDARCFQDHSLTTKNVLWGIAKVATLAIGLKGTTTGNANYASLSSGSEQALGSHSSSEGSATMDDVKLSGIATKLHITVFGAVDKSILDKYLGVGADHHGGYVFPIGEVEEHLTHYKVIPYKAKPYM